MDRNVTSAMIVASVLSACQIAQAQSLRDPTPVGRVMEVAQFGMPQDAKLIFCDGQDCPERTVKTATTIGPVALPALKSLPVVALQPKVVLQQVTRSPGGLLPAGVTPVEALGRKETAAP